TGLTGDAGVDVRAMGKAHEIGQRIDAVPTNFEVGLRVVGPWTSHRQQAARFLAAVASDAALHGRNTRGRRPPGIFMTILAGNLVDPGMDSMAERDRLLDIVTGSPRPLRKSDRADTGSEHYQRKRKQSAVQIQIHFKSGAKTLPPVPLALPASGNGARILSRV